MTWTPSRPGEPGARTAAALRLGVGLAAGVGQPSARSHDHPSTRAMALLIDLALALLLAGIGRMRAVPLLAWTVAAGTLVALLTRYLVWRRAPSSPYLSTDRDVGWSLLGATASPGPWLRHLGAVNVAAAGLAVVAVLLLMSPALDPARLSVADRLRRIGPGPVSQEGIEALRHDMARFGVAAMRRLAGGPDARVAEMSPLGRCTPSPRRCRTSTRAACAWAPTSP